MTVIMYSHVSLERIRFFLKIDIIKAFIMLDRQARGMNRSERVRKTYSENFSVNLRARV